MQRLLMKSVDLSRAALQSFCIAGLLLGTLFFAVSLTPSLVPRPFVLQALLCGVALAAGYAVGAAGLWLWRYLELPIATGRAAWLIKRIMTALCVGVAVMFLVRASVWQNSVRALMEMDPVEGTRPMSLGLIALLVFTLLVAAGRLFRLVARQLSRQLRRVVPRRVSGAVAVLATGFVFWALVNGVMVRWVLSSFDASFSQLNVLIEAQQEAPRDPAITGSPASLVDWNELGRQGRSFIASAPTTADLRAFGFADAQQPVRVYVGLSAAESIDQRVALALAELHRTGAFERRILVVITPTGTGWVDPGGINSLEYLHRGDVASVAIQYSYLPSWLTLLAQPDYGAETARELFRAVYDHWRSLPPETRPQLYLHGLSLGALNSQRSVDVWDIVGDPLHGALWSGPPFRSATWRWVTRHRNPDSPAWLPTFRDGSVIRFTNQHNRLADFDAGWGPLRIVYLQYASDPITFFETESLYREPAWMSGERGPDVSPALRWTPIVTMLQLAVDIVAADTAPIGHGHSYATEHYIDAWLAVTGVEGWSAGEIDRLKAHIGDLR